jgi:hypothetical protein
VICTVPALLELRKRGVFWNGAHSKTTNCRAIAVGHRHHHGPSTFVAITLFFTLPTRTRVTSTLPAGDISWTILSCRLHQGTHHHHHHHHLDGSNIAIISRVVIATVAVVLRQAAMSQCSCPRTGPWKAVMKQKHDIIRSKKQTMALRQSERNVSISTHLSKSHSVSKYGRVAPGFTHPISLEAEGIKRTTTTWPNRMF